MANDTYTADANGKVFAGRFNLPSWIRNQAVNTWGTVPLAQTWTDADPALDASVNPNFPSNAPWRGAVGFPARFAAWSGMAAYDGVLYDPIAGGHTDYAGNEGFKCDLKSESPSVVRLNNPSGAIGNEITLNDGQESTGLYADGRPRATHNYNSPVYYPPTNKVLVGMHGTGLYISGSGGTKRPVIFSPTTGEMELYGAAPSGSVGNGFSMCSTYDSSRELIWVRGGGSCAMFTYDPKTDTQTQRGNAYALSGDTTCCYIPEHDVIVIIAGSNFVVFDCTAFTYTPITLSGSLVGMTLSGNCQIHYIGNNTLATWNNTTDTTIVNTFSFASNPKTDNWAIGQLSVAAENAITPTVKTANGTFGRFQWHDKLRIFTLINAVNQSLYFFKVA